MRRISIPVLLVFFSCSSPVLAARHHKTPETYSTNPFTRAVEVAVVYWGRSIPCHRLPVVRFSTPPPITEVSAGPLQGALAKGKVELESWVNLASAAKGECIVFLNNSIWNSSAIGILEFHMLCNMMTHEVGHFIGHEDEGATNPLSITYPEETPQNENSVIGCLQHSYPHALTNKIRQKMLQAQRKVAKE